MRAIVTNQNIHSLLVLLLHFILDSIEDVIKEDDQGKPKFTKDDIS